MALQVWLPLTKDLSNQGLADVVITNNGATFNNTAGKLGGCYYFTPNQWIKISMPEHMTTIKNITVAAWIKSHSNTLALGGISHNGNSALAGVSLYTNGWQLSGNSSTYKYITSGITANNQVWHHAACTIADDEVTTYVDGVKVFSTTLTAQGVTSTNITSDHFIEIGCDHPGGDEYFTGYINDFRIYDHCLSAKEVKELSKGLVLHYKLDNGGTGPTNLLKNGFGELGTENWDIPANVTTTGLPTADPTIKAKVLNTTSEEFIPVYRNHTYKISAYVKSSYTSTTGYTYPSIRVYDIDKYEIQHYNTLVGFNLATMTTLKQDLKSGDTKIYVNDLSQWNANSGHYYNHAAIFGYTDSTGYTYPDGVYTRITPTFGTSTNAKTNLDKTNNVITLNAAYSGSTIPAGTSVCASTDGATYFYPFGGITLASIQDWVFKEATFSAENSRIVAAAYMKVMSYVNGYLAGITLTDESVNNMLDHTKEFDCSGYGHNGDIIGTLTNSIDTPKYTVSSHIGANTIKIHVSGLTTAGFGNSYSFAWWAKCATWSNMMHWGFSDGIRFNGIYNGNLWNTGDGSGNPLYIPGTTTQVAVPDTNWHHWVMTGNGTKCYVYKDGILWAEAKTYKAISGTSIYINGWDSSTSYSNSDLDISDFRIYATVLSAEDVAELYHTAASIDNHGNIYAGELKEV